MSFSVMLSQLAKGMTVTTEIFVSYKKTDGNLAVKPACKGNDRNYGNFLCNPYIFPATWPSGLLG